MRKVYAIAINTFREAVRDRILYLLLIFAILIMSTARVVSLLTIGSEEKIVKDVGLAAINIFSVLIGIFVGVGLVFKEIEKKTIYTIVTKPIERYQFIVGKYFGLTMTVFINLVIMAVIFYMVLAIQSYFDPDLGKAILLTFVEILVVTAIAILFSSFSTPILSSVFTISLYVIGHLSWSFLLLKNYVDVAWGKRLCDFFYYVVPNLEYFNIRSEVVHGIPLNGWYILSASAYGVGWSLLLITLASIIFQRRNFN
ncbi:MAG: ABC transporter permease subunit [Acidobacteriota bacterium]